MENLADPESGGTLIMSALTMVNLAGRWSGYPSNELDLELLEMHIEYGLPEYALHSMHHDYRGWCFEDSHVQLGIILFRLAFI